jgi:putative hydrolase of the HAD superfamily
MVKAVLFDLDGTLWDRDGAVRQIFQAQHDAFPELVHVPKDRYVDRAMTLDNRGRRTKREVYQQIVKEFNLPLSLGNTLHADFRAKYRDCYALFPDVLPTLRRLAELGLKLGIITNGNASHQEPKIVGLGLATLVDTTLISGNEGVRKPDPAIFERALQRLGITADTAWFVGDNADADVRGAKEAGMTAVLRRSLWSTTAEDATHVISTLDELIPLIAGTTAAT